MTNFSDDLKEEKVIAQWMDKYFYKKIDRFELGILRPEEIKDLERIKKAQYMGIDIVLKDKYDSMYFVDEKSQTTHKNKNLPSFAFEIIYYKDGQERLGWLFDENKKTTHYILISPNVIEEKKKMKLKNFEDITWLKVYFIKRDLILNTINQLGLTKEKLIDKAQNIKKENCSLPIEGIPETIVAINKSGWLAERPTNLVVKKKVLDNLALSIWRISKEGIECEKNDPIFKFEKTSR